MSGAALDDDIAHNLSTVRRRLEAATHGSGRDPRLIAVSKTFPVEAVVSAARVGQRDFGENRVQEGLDKIAATASLGLTWHLIGHLQRNKDRQATAVFELIHSVDSLRLAQEIDRRAAEVGGNQQILVQVNLSHETTKFGVAEGELPALLDGIVEMPSLRLRGLMTIPPPAESPEDSRRWFAGMRELQSGWSTRLGIPLTELSMGMTDDFEVAVEEGATLVRVGRAIFGERQG